jgi:F-type H+-transporting ATPase subunit b
MTVRGGEIKSVFRRWALVATLASLTVGGLALFSPARARAEEGAKASGEPATSEVGYQPGAESAVEAPPSINVKKLGLQVLNFSVLLFILIKFGGPAISKALAARHSQMKADLAAASAARADAEARLAVQEKRLGALEQEIESIRTGVKAEAQAEKARLIALAEERAKRIKEETSFALGQQVKEAEERLRREVAMAAVDLAEQMVRKSLGAADQQRFVDTFVTDVATGQTGTPRSRGDA